MVLIFSAVICFEATAAEFRAKYRAATVTPPSHMHALGTQQFAKLIKERTNGRIEIEVYPGGTLAKGERELFEAVQQGTIDFYMSSTGAVGGFVPQIMIFDIPFLFRDFAHADKVLDGPIGRKILDYMDAKDVKGLAFWENGFRNVTNNKRPLKVPADIKGVTIRTMENKIHLASFKAMGANPVPMTWGEVYSALQQGTIDGQENPVVLIRDSKLNEVQKYLSMTKHFYNPAILAMNKKKFDAMPLEDQKLFLETAREVAPFQRNIGRNNEAAALDEMEKKGMKIERNIDEKLWAAACSSVRPQFDAQFGKENINAIINTQ